MLESLLRRTITVGDLSVDEGDGRIRRFGDGGGRPVAIRLQKGAAVKLAMNLELKLGECFMDGELVFEQGDMYDLLEIVSRNPGMWDRPWTPLRSMRQTVVKRLRQANDRGHARRNVAHHYDLSHELYSRFLDADMQYSCAYFAHPQATLDEAQAAKKAHIAAKLALPPPVGCSTSAAAGAASG